ncbi:MAG: hypothetical protein JAZ15_03665 [Candidatus Thiodiazotropha endolucinida]|nr:hypothetical protein [Candidatus Thiodiazotropha taylori]MCW4312094.1 hypothetical protein [Candidatus Thiodiazotropha taylori]
MEKESINIAGNSIKMTNFSPIVVVMMIGATVAYMGEALSDSITSQIATITGLFMVLGGGSVLLYSFIKGGNRLYAPSDFVSRDLQKIKAEISSIQPSAKLENEITAIRNTLNKLQSSTIDFNEDDKQELLKGVKESVEKNISSGVIEEIESKYSSEMIKSSGMQSIRARIEETIERLRSELDKLNRRAATNLAIGSITTVLAAALLAYMVLDSNLKLGDSTQAILWHYVPRLSIIIFIEVFAFFFLRLYRENIHESKYFQNEITNLDSKFIALDAALISNDVENVKTLVQELATTERNHILKKGETTVDLERERSETQTLKDIVNSLTGILKKK